MGEQKGYIRNADEKGSVNISEDVIAIIAANATLDVEGVNGFYYSQGKELTQMIGKRGYIRGVKLGIDGDEITIDVYIMVERGYSVNEIGKKIQDAIISAVEDAVGAKVSAVNVHVCGVAMKRSKQ